MNKPCKKHIIYKVGISDGWETVTSHTYSTKESAEKAKLDLQKTLWAYHDSCVVEMYEVEISASYDPTKVLPEKIEVDFEDRDGVLVCIRASRSSSWGGEIGKVYKFGKGLTSSYMQYYVEVPFDFDRDVVVANATSIVKEAITRGEVQDATGE